MQRTAYILLGQVWKIHNVQHEEILPFLYLLILGGSGNFSKIKNYKPQNINQEKIFGKKNTNHFNISLQLKAIISAFLLPKCFMYFNESI